MKILALPLLALPLMAMTYKPDVGDVWDASCPEYGDCEDMALCEARKTLERGVDGKDIMVIVGHNHGGAHAISSVNGILYDPTGYPTSSFTPAYACRMDGKVLVFLSNGRTIVYDRVPRIGTGCISAFQQLGIRYK